MLRDLGAGSLMSLSLLPIVIVMIIALSTAIPALLGVVFLVIFRGYDLESKIGGIRAELDQGRTQE